ncbi:hypothetical protein, partial [Pelomonas sp. KK5]|uniref:hypothetical protein n=1 Tax=Pelomonas sp. KK5 TaxID=1855730 RepID=UPI00117FA073
MRRLLLALALFVAAPAVQADTLLYRLTGVTGVIDDPNGVLGAPAPGTAFQLDYFADFSLGWRGG